MRAMLRTALCLTALWAAVPSPSAPVQQPAAPDTVTPKSATPLKDTAAVVKPKSRSDTVIVVKHEFHHREQIITGSVIMSCLALILVAMNNYNPR